MEYAVLGRTGLRVSRLGFGCMRLPMKSDKEVDRDKTIPMLQRAVELGINYFDTAVMYCGHDSERVLGEALEDVRDQVILSTKNHHYDKKDTAGWWKNLEDSLEFLRTGCIDIYNVHGLDYEGYESNFAGEDGLYKELLKAKEQGLIRHICHSFHGTCESLKQMVDTGLFEAVTCQYNLLDRHLEEGIAYAAAHDVGVVIMGPVGGGRLGYPSEKAAELVGEVKSTPELALRFVLSNENVTVALSGMSEMRHLEENVATVAGSAELSRQDHTQIAGAIQERKQLMGLYCTGCGYCMPCPEGVDIPANFEILNLDRVFGLTEHAKGRYASLAGKAALCRLCGKCVEPCPQDLDIPARLAEAVAILDERAGSVTGWSELRGAAVREGGTLELDLRYHVKNFTDQSQRVEVEFQPHGEDQVDPVRFELAELKAYGRRHKDVRIEVRPPLEALSVDALLTFDGSRALEHLHHIVTAAPQADGYMVDASRRRAGGHHVPSPLHPIHQSDQPVRGHSFDFVPAYDEENLYVFADVEDDLLCPAREEIKGRARADNLRIFLDGREPARIGRGKYEDGVMHLTVYPPAEEGGEPQVRTSNDSEVKVELARTPFGYRVDCAIPWEVFSQTDGRPGVIGFDIAVNSHNEEGKDVLRL
ncbi:MAG: aldo/keto reductase, partial [Planctomycetota bacterium]